VFANELEIAKEAVPNKDPVITPFTFKSPLILILAPLLSGLILPE
jgi:hypothetical protein